MIRRIVSAPIYTLISSQNDFLSMGQGYKLMAQFTAPKTCTLYVSGAIKPVSGVGHICYKLNGSDYVEVTSAQGEVKNFSFNLPLGKNDDVQIYSNWTGDFAN